MMMVSSNGKGGYPLIDSVINQHTDPSANHNINTQTMKMKKVLLFMFDHRSINYFLFWSPGNNHRDPIGNFSLSISSYSVCRVIATI